MIPLRSKEELEIMRRGGRILAGILQKLQEYIKPQIMTQDIDALAQELFEKEKVKSAFKGYRGYPANICASVNEEVVHGIPGERALVEGDIVGIDLGIEYEGFFTDAAVTVPVGRTDARKSKLIEVTRQALFEGISQAQPQNRVSDISYVIQSYAERYGFSVVRQFVGHGIGRALHEEPEIPNYGSAHRGQILQSGMVLAIEPMVNAGSWECEILANGWTAITVDRFESAHFEHTVAVTENGPEILTINA